MSVDVCLINMPYSSIERPSLALGLIDTYISAFDYTVEVIYGNLEFAAVIGVPQYYAIESTNHEDLLGEWIFSRLAFPEIEVDDAAYFHLFPHYSTNLYNIITAVREQAKLFIKDMAAKIIALEPKIVGCTSTFQQNCASLALLRTIKESRPDIITIMGGGNCEGIMGQTICDSFTWVDYVFSGECDEVIGSFVNQLMSNDKCIDESLPDGILTRKKDVIMTDQKPSRVYVNDMSKVGTPIYDSYFNTIRRLDLTNYIEPGLLVETSRGCWWGAKKHCTFCGLNGLSLDHRSKDPSVVIDEFRQLSSKYGLKKLEIVDNILPVEYMKTLVPQLAEASDNFSIFYETKANINQEQAQKLADAGIKWIQPGIESLHDDFLKLIDKGTKAIQNVSALKWCRESGVRVSWNILSCAPNEKDEWYFEMAEWLPLISHLQAPQQSMIKIRYPRFSPYFNTPDKYGLTLQPIKSYEYVYPLSGDDLFNIAYFFEAKTKDTVAAYSLQNYSLFDSPGHQALQKKILEWSNLFWLKPTPPLLCMIEQGESIRVIDTRQVATQLSHQLIGLSATVYRLCYKPITLSSLFEKLVNIESGWSEEDINRVLTELLDNKLMIYLSGQYMALALVGEVPMLPKNEDYPGGILYHGEKMKVKKTPDIWSGSFIA